LALSLPLLLFWWLLFPPLALLVVGLLLLYLFIILVTSVIIAVREDFSLAPLLPPVFLTIRLGLGVGFLLGPILALRRWLTIR
jgi:hypothetical protein